MDDWIVRATGTAIDLIALAAVVWALGLFLADVYGLPAPGLVWTVLVAIALKLGAWALRGRAVMPRG